MALVFYHLMVGSYVQAPLQDCTEEKYNELMKYITDIDLSEVVEYTDETDLKDQAACAGRSLRGYLN